MTKEESIPVIAEIKSVLTECDWFATDATMSNPNGSNTDTHIHMTRILWDDEGEYDGDESWNIHFDEDDGYITAEYEYDGLSIPMPEFIDETNLKNGKLYGRLRSIFTRGPGYGRNLIRHMKQDGLL